MMGPEAALVSDRIAELRALGKCAGAVKPRAAVMYAEAAVQAYLEPPARSPGAWARLRAALRGRPVAERGGEAAWTVAAAPIVVKEELATAAGGTRTAESLLAAIPLCRDAQA